MDEESSDDDNESRKSSMRNLAVRFQGDMQSFKQDLAVLHDKHKETMKGELEELRVFIHTVLTEVEGVQKMAKT
jgi:hypothetical protein